VQNTGQAVMNTDVGSRTDVLKDTVEENGHQLGTNGKKGHDDQRSYNTPLHHKLHDPGHVIEELLHGELLEKSGDYSPSIILLRKLFIY
jgi:hypothetical protein